MRAFFENHFIPYQVVAADGRDTGMVTGYYEPLLDGSRVRSARYNVPLYAAPDDLLTIDLDRALSGAQGTCGCAGASRASASSRIGRAPTSKTGPRRSPTRRSSTSRIRSKRSSCRSRAPAASRLAEGASCASGMPTRTVTRIARSGAFSSIAASCRSSARRCRESATGDAAIRRSSARSSTRIRATCSSAKSRRPRPARSKRRSTAHSDRSACRCCASARSPWIRARFRSARRSTSRRRIRLSTRPLTRLVLAQDTGGAIRGAVRADFFWGFGDDAGREAGRMKQDGRMWILWPKDAPPPSTR